MADTLAELLSNVAAFKKGSATANKEIINILGQQADLGTEISATYKQQATDDVTVATAKNAADFETQLSKVRAANALGTNLKSNTEVVTALAKESADAYATKQAALAEVTRKRSINFLDSPLEFIAAQFSVESDITTHNLANARQQQAENRLQNINSLTQATVQTQMAISEPLTGASVDAANRTAAVAATVASKKATMETLNYSTQAINVALNSSKEVLALEFQAQGAKNAARSLQLSEENAAQSRIEFSYRQKEYQERAADKQAQDDLGKSVVDTINLGRKALLGAKGTPIDDFSGKMAINALRTKGVLSDELKVYYEAGERSKLEGRVIIGTSPSAAAETLQRIPVQLNPTQAPIKQLLGQAMQATDQGIKEVASMGKASNPVFNGVNPKDKVSTSKAYNAAAQQLLDGYSRNINPNDSSNPYQIASVNQLVANSPTVRDLPVVRKVLAPVMATGMQLTDANQVMKLVSDAVLSKKITQKEALDVTAIYHVGVKANMAMRNFEGFGLQPSNRYNTTIEINPDAFSSTTVVDMTKPEQVSRAFMQINAAKVQKSFSEGRNISRGQAPAGYATAKPVTPPVPYDPKTSLLPPNPELANRMDAFADSVAPAVENFFRNLPTASDFEPAPISNRQKSGLIRPAQ